VAIQALPYVNAATDIDKRDVAGIDQWMVDPPHCNVEKQCHDDKCCTTYSPENQLSPTMQRARPGMSSSLSALLSFPTGHRASMAAM